MHIVMVSSFYQPIGNSDCSTFSLLFRNAFCGLLTIRTRETKSKDGRRKKIPSVVPAPYLSHVASHLRNQPSPARVTGSSRVGFGDGCGAGRRVWAGSEFTHVRGRTGRQEENLKEGDIFNQTQRGRRGAERSGRLRRRRFWRAPPIKTARSLQATCGAVFFESGEWKLQPCVVGHVISALMTGRRPRGGGAGG